MDLDLAGRQSFQQHGQLGSRLLIRNGHMRAEALNLVGARSAAILAEAPTIAVIPDVLFRAVPPDLIRRLRSVLGIET